MAVLGSDRLTLLDWARRVDPNGQIAAVVETLNQFNEILDDITFVEGNLPTGHKVTVRASLPTPTWRRLNKGVASTKSTSTAIIETTGMLEAYSVVDKDLADLNGNTAAFRYSEDTAHIESMNQEVVYDLIYGDTTVDPEEFTGLKPRYNALSGNTTYGNVISAGGSSTDNTSIYLVGWSPSTVMGIFPKGSKAGLQVTDKGLQTVYDSDGNPFEAYRTHFQWKVGIAVKDWRYVSRICNIDISDLETAGDASDTSANLLKYMCQGIDKLPSLGAVRPVFYAHNRVISMLRVKLLNKSNTYLTLSDWTNPALGITRKTLTFMGIPVRRIDQIAVNESTVS